ncbi:MAG: hypothetical protein H0W18_05955 [Acidobacteria bacterium]|nr:hypothetical protein [Acidobacteriota bacterium]
MTIRRHVAMWIAYAAVTLVMMAPLVNYAALGSASYPGDARLIIWTLAWDNHAVLNALPLFDANVFYPAQRSLAYNDHLFGLSLFTLPIYTATGNAVLAYNIVWILSFILSGVAMHALLRRYTGRELAAFAGSLVYTLSFYRMLHAHGHLPLVWTWLLPLSLLALHRWNDRPSGSRALLWGAAVTLQALTSWYLAVLVAVANTALLIALATQWRQGWGRRVAHVAAAAALVILCVWPFAREYLGLAPVLRSEAVSSSADAASYLVPPENTWPGRMWLARIGDGPRWIWGESTVFLGWTALALGMCGVVIGVLQRSRLASFYLLLALAAFSLSLGPAAIRAEAGWRPFDLLAQLPMVNAFRAPARFALLVLLGLSVLVAIAVSALQSRFPIGSRMALAVLLPLMLSEWYVVGFPAGKPAPFETPPIYRRPELRTARAIVSLPDYRETAVWWGGADYFFYSMAHWRPIVNGFGRGEPPEHFRVVSHMRAFPGPNNVRTMRRLGVEYLVLHADRYGPGVDEVLRVAQTMPEYTLVTQIGQDYLFRINP